MNTSFKTIAYNAICSGVQTNNVKLIERGQKALSVYGQAHTHGDIGFTRIEISDKYDYLSEKLEGLNSKINPLKVKLSRINEKIRKGNGTGVSKTDRRDEHLKAMADERHNSTLVTA